MSTVTDDLRTSLESYTFAVLDLGDRRLERDTSKRHLKELEAEIFAEQIKLGVIDGKNAETRDAQAQLAFKASTRWQNASDQYVSSENRFMSAQDHLTIALAELRVAATLVNVHIAEIGSAKLLAEINLAGI